MCGISAIISMEGRLSNKNEINQLHSNIKHRGPDSCNFVFLDKVHLAHHRLAIIDVKKESDQPFNINNELFIVFNGEIYNYIEIRNELIKKGVKFRTESDTEVILNSYRVWGKECIHKFNGMWAFLIVDLKKNKIFCSRDRYGIKPFYYTVNNQKLYIASELKQFTNFEFGRSANFEQVSIYLFSGLSNTSNQTFYENIFSLNPGENMDIDLIQRTISKNKWYFANKNNKEINKFDLKKLINSVDLRLRSDVPLGCFLSGGVDSSIIASISNNILKANITSFHSQSIDKKNDELNYAIEMCKFSKSKLLFIKPKFNDFLENIDDLVWTQDEPFGGLSVLMQYLLFKKVNSEGIKVILDGQGADEIMMGYPKYFSYILYKNIKDFNLPRLIKDSNNIFKNNFSMNFCNQIKYYIATYNPQLRSIFNQINFEGNFKKLPELEKIYKNYSNSFKDLKDIQLIDTYETSLQSLLRTEDRNSMRHSVESRLPFLDYLNYEHCLNLRSDEKLKDGWTKYSLRNLKIIPDKISWRKDKIGFNSPSQIWIDKYSPIMKTEIKKSNLLEYFLNKKIIIKRWEKLSCEQKWRLFNLSKWEELFKINS